MSLPTSLESVKLWRKVSGNKKRYGMHLLCNWIIAYAQILLPNRTVFIFIISAFTCFGHKCDHVQGNTRFIDVHSVYHFLNIKLKKRGVHQFLIRLRNWRTSCRCLFTSSLSPTFTHPRRTMIQSPLSHLTSLEFFTSISEYNNHFWPIMCLLIT